MRLSQIHRRALSVSLAALAAGCHFSLVTLNVQPPKLLGSALAQPAAEAALFGRAHYRHDGAILLPDARWSPGVPNPAHDTAVICHQSTRPWRHTTQAMKDSVYAEYGLQRPRRAGSYEVDHIVPLEDGGADVVGNLFPQPAAPAPGFHEKDQVENWVHREVCAGRLNLAAAQRQLAQDWATLYRHMQAQSAALEAQ